MKLPFASAYYYHGVKTDYNLVVASIQAYSSIILVKNSDNSGYNYGVVIDPYFSEPQIYKNDNVKLIDQLKNSQYLYVYTNGNAGQFTSNSLSLSDEDVVYFVSDIWNRNTYVNDYYTKAYGKITAIAPSYLNPNIITLSGKDYTISQDKVK